MAAGFLPRSALALTIVLALAACESSEERAERHFQSGLELLEAGDVDRAIVEFRNVFQLDAAHLEARLAFARAELERGELSSAYRQYLAASEIDPDNIEARIVLAETAALAMDWDAVERHYAVIVADGSQMDDPQVQAIGIALEFRDAVVEEDMTAVEGIGIRAGEMVEMAPDNMLLRRILIEFNLLLQRPGEALAQIEEALRIDPEERLLYDIKVRVLAQLEDADALAEELLNMIALYPEDQALEQTLLRLYVGTNQPEKAEGYLRERAQARPEDDSAKADIAQFILRTRGAEAAMAEVEAMLSESPDNMLLLGLQGSLMFDMGQRDEAITMLQSLIEGEEPSAESAGVRLALSRMLSATGNEVGARRLVEEVLSVDPTNVQALKSSAEWLIEDDRTDEAINTLRTALDQAPEDPDLRTLMARAYERAGNTQLSREMLALAVEASGNAPAESIRYAELLINGEQIRTAEDVLIESLRLNENNLGLLRALGGLYVVEADWPRADRVVRTLRGLENETANEIADALQVEILRRQDRTDETIAFLRNLATENPSASGAIIGIAREHLANGETDQAIAVMDDAVEENPDSPQLRFAAAVVRGATGDLEGAAERLEAMVEGGLRGEPLWIELMRTYNRMGERERALDALTRGLADNPGSPNLLWAQASVLEQNGDYEGAISVYETLYESNSNIPVIANNLASMISTYRTDEESLDRAWAVARRLRGSDVPQFQDTYGWIAYRRGEIDQALEHLEPAAAALGGDALVQYHLGKTYMALDRSEDALTQFRRAVEVAGDADLRPQIDEARQLILQLESATAPE